MHGVVVVVVVVVDVEAPDEVWGLKRELRRISSFADILFSAVLIEQGVVSADCTWLQGFCLTVLNHTLAFDGPDIDPRDSCHGPHPSAAIPSLLPLLSPGHALVRGAGVRWQPRTRGHGVSHAGIRNVQLQRLRVGHGHVLQLVRREQVVRHHGRLCHRHQFPVDSHVLHRLLGGGRGVHVECGGRILHGGVHEPDGESGADEGPGDEAAQRRRASHPRQEKVGREPAI